MKVNKLKKKYLKAKQEKKKEIFKEGEIRLSAIGSCMRAQVYSGLGYPRKEPNSKKLGIFEMGDRCEKFVYDIYKKEYGKENVLKQVQIESFSSNKDGSPIIGHADLYVIPEDILIEVKNIKSGAKYFNLPKEEHKWQLIAYLHFFHKTFKGKLIYVVKDTLELITFPIDNTGFRLSCASYGIDSRLNKIRKGIEEKKLPKREHKSPNKYPCFWKTRDGETGGCDFRKRCWRLE